MNWKGEVVVQAGNKIKENIVWGALPVSGSAPGLKVKTIDEGTLGYTGVEGKQDKSGIQAIASFECCFQAGFQ
jgi:hypothetical protein